MVAFSCLKCGKIATGQCEKCASAVYCSTECLAQDRKKHSALCVNFKESQFDPAVQNRWTGLFLEHARLFADWANELRREYEPKHPAVARAKADMLNQLDEWSIQSKNPALPTLMQNYGTTLVDFGTAVVLCDEKQNNYRRALQESIAQGIEQVLQPNTSAAIKNHTDSYRHAWAKNIDAMERFLGDEEFKQEHLEEAALKAGQVFWGRVSKTVFTQ